MDTYIRSSLVRDMPMSRAEYIRSKGSEVSDDDDGSRNGFLIQNNDDAAFWMPFEDFELVYRKLQRFGFEGALTMLKAGQKLARAGWNGKGQFVYMVPAAKYAAQTGAAKSHYGEEAFIPYNAYLALKGVDDTVSTWVPSISDVFAEDWSVV